MERGLSFTKCMCSRSQNCGHKRDFSNPRKRLVGGGHRQRPEKARKEIGYFERKPAFFPSARKVVRQKQRFISRVAAVRGPEHW